MKIIYTAPLNSYHTYRWLKFFIGKGHDVHVFRYKNEDVSDIENLTIHDLNTEATTVGIVKNIFKFLRIKRKLDSIVRKIKPDIIHAHWIDPYAFMASRTRVCPFIVTAWGSDVLVEPKKSSIKRYIVKRVLKRADRITCDAEHMKDAMTALGADRNKIDIIYFGTDCTKFNPEKNDSGLVRELGFPSNTNLVVSMRALKSIYNIETFVNAIPLILDKHKNTGFIIVGEGPEKEMLMKTAEDLDVIENVRFAGRLSDDDMQRYVASSDVYVSTSLSDGGIAASTAEAMASGVPVVVSDFGNNRDWVEEGISGLLFPLKDYATLAEKVVYLLDHPEKSVNIAQEGRKIIETRNNWHLEMEKVHTVYNSLQRVSV